MPNLVLFNIGWMKRYRGEDADDQIVNGGPRDHENEGWDEVWNFLPNKKKCYGYVRSGRGGTLGIARLGATKDADYVDNVTVVFTATRPGGGRVVAGWYHNARVWRDTQGLAAGAPREDWRYFAEANERDCVLLSPDDRVFPVPRAKKGVWGMGQANVRFLDEPGAGEFLKRLTAYIKAPKTATVTSGAAKHGSPRQSDPALRAKVEAAAVARVVAHYESKGFDCRSVEKDNVGWDIDVTRGAVTLLVEVKGCSGANAVVEVTPNEYRSMRERRDNYRVAIVTDALKANRSRLLVLSYNIADDSWRDEDGKLANLKEIMAARISL